MLTEKDKAFIIYWEQNREHENRPMSKLVNGLPMAMLFGLPMILFIIIVRLYFPDWYMKISETSPGMFITAIFAMLIIIFFYSFFRMQFKCEMNEQLYRELKLKEKKQSIQSTND